MPQNDNDDTSNMDEDIEFIQEIGMHENTPVIRTIDKPNSSHNTTDPAAKPTAKLSNSSINPLNLQILTNNGDVNIHELHTLQEDLIQNTTISHTQGYSE